MRAYTVFHSVCIFWTHITLLLNQAVALVGPFWLLLARLDEVQEELLYYPPESALALAAALAKC